MTRFFAIYKINAKFNIALKCFVLAALLIYFWQGPAAAREIVDMTGRTVTIPDKIEKIYVMSQANLVYTLNPGLLCGLPYPLRDEEKAMMDPRMQELPVLGTFNGVGEKGNPEMFMAVKPDLIISSILTGEDRETASQEKEAALFDLMGIPYVYIKTSNLYDYPATYEFLGELLGYEGRAKVLADYIRATLAEAAEVIAKVPPEQRPKVYYAEQLDGLSTESLNSFHVALLKIVGDVNVHRHKSKIKDTVLGYEKLSLEEIMAYNPDFILAYDEIFYRQVYKNPGWKSIKAVQNKNVLWIPRGPHNWFDRPPSYMRVLGIKWLLANLYPEHYQIDMVQEAIDFYKLFLFWEATPAEMRKIIYPFE